jgi:hypothetical protein
LFVPLFLFHCQLLVHCFARVGGRFPSVANFCPCVVQVPQSITG